MGGPSARPEPRRSAPAVLDRQVPERRFDLTEVDCSRHDVERQVQRVLTSHPGLTVSNLVVRRLRDGVCLTGVIESIESDTDVCGLVREVAGVNEVVNRMLVRSGSAD
jgi:hypothetical protein